MEPADDACVVVARTLLDALERDKRTLKWQLARATKAAETHAAERAASEAKLKDLMTIVEMNKSVAHKALQRNYTKESVLQRLHQERVQLQSRVETQQRRGLEKLETRRRFRLLRDVLRAWTHEAMTQCRRRRAICCVLRRRRRRWLQDGFRRWLAVVPRVSEATVDPRALVYPIPPTTFAYVASEKPPPSSRPLVRFALSSTLSARSISTITSPAMDDVGENSRKSLSFATWKAHWLTRRRQHTTAIHFARLMLTKRVLLAWKHVVRLRNWREAMVANALQRRRYQCFGLWVGWTKTRRRARRLLAKLARRFTRRILLTAFTKLRIRSLEKSMNEWSTVLQEARQAMDEEREIYSLHQSEAMQEIEQKAACQEMKLAQVMQAQLDAILKRQRLALLMKYVATWQRRVMVRAVQTRLADQFHRVRCRRRLVDRPFSLWKTIVRQQRALKEFQRRRARNQARNRMRTVFTAFSRFVKWFRARQTSLRRIVMRRCMLASSRAFWVWRGVIAVGDEKVSSQLDKRHLVSRLEIREATSRSEAERLRRIGYKYQLRCALALGDVRRERHKRHILRIWKIRTIRIIRRRIALQKIFTFTSRHFLKLATDRWWQAIAIRKHFEEKLQEKIRRRLDRTRKEFFDAWRTATHKSLLSSAQGGLQFVSLMLWKKHTRQQHARRVALAILLKSHARYRWAKPAFAKWRQHLETVAIIEEKLRARHQELLHRIFHGWVIWFSRRSQQKKRQFEKVASQAELRTTNGLIVCVWTAWREYARQGRTMARLCLISGSLVVRNQRSVLLQRLWRLWSGRARRWTMLRRALTRCFSRRTRVVVDEAWRTWQAIIIRERGIQTGQDLLQNKISRRLRQQNTLRQQREIVRQWNRVVVRLKHGRQVADRRAGSCRRAFLARCFVLWRCQFVPHMHMRRLMLRAIIKALRKRLLRSSLQGWRSLALQVTSVSDHQHVSAHRAKVQSQALVFLRRTWASRDLRSCFVAWKVHVRNSQHQKQLLRKLCIRNTMRFLKSSWIKWVAEVTTRAFLDRVAKVWLLLVQRRSWRQLRQITMGCKAREQAASRLCKTVAKAIVRCTWNQWKRRDNALLISRTARAENAPCTVLDAFMNRVGLRHFRKSTLQQVFSKWKSHAQHQRLLRRRVLLLLTKQDSRSVKNCFTAWIIHVQNVHSARLLLWKILQKRHSILARTAFDRWQAHVNEILTEARLRGVQMQLKRQREALVRRFAKVMFFSWQRPTLGAVLRGWKNVVEDQKRVLEQSQLRRSRRVVSMVWLAWQDKISTRKLRTASCMQLLLRKKQRTLSYAWRLWILRIWWIQDVEASIHRLTADLQLRLVRFAWRRLRLHQDMEMRRQSMMVVVSAQNQLRQQKELHRLRYVASLLQRQSKRRLRERFGLWKRFTDRRRQRKAIYSTMVRRYARSVLRAMLRSWRGTVVHRRSQNRRIQKWQNTQCHPRCIRLVWHAWSAFVEERCNARHIFQRLVESLRKQILLAAWNRWYSVVEEQVEAEKAHEIAHWRRATTMQQNQVASLEAKTELLLLESVELRNTVYSQRQRCAEAFVRKIARVVETALARKLADRWYQWISLIKKLRVIRRTLDRFVASRQHQAFLRWKQETSIRRICQHETLMMEKVARILGASTLLMQKKKVWRQWIAFATYRRAKSVQQRVIDMQRRKQGVVLIIRYAFSSWRTVVRSRKWRDKVVEAMAHARRTKLVRCTMRSWVKYRQDERSRREGLLMLSRIHRAFLKRTLQRGWLQWRNYVAETAVVLATSRVVVMEAETSEQEVQHINQSCLLRVISAWRETTRHQLARRNDIRMSQELYDALWRKQQAMREWRGFVYAKKLHDARRQQPVLCVRTNVRIRGKTNVGKSREEDQGAVLSLAEYTQHRCRVHWRVHLTRRVAHTRLRRVCGLAWLLRSLRRQHLRMQRRALWRWFAAIQPISCALQAVRFEDLPWRRVDVEYGGSMLLLTLEELDLTRQTFRTEIRQRAWSVVNAIVRSHQRQATRRAFDKWRLSRQKRPVSSWGLASTRRLLLVEDRTANTVRARARACIVQLTRVQVRRAFGVWKAEYVASAIEQAQAQYDSLQAALARTAIERRTMDASA